MTLADVLAVLRVEDTQAVALVRAVPAIAQVRVAEERFVEELPHQVYVGDTALHLAAAALRPAVVEALLENGADANAENRRGAAALHYACDLRPQSRTPERSAAQRVTIERLIAAGAAVEHRDHSGTTPLHRAVRARSPEAVRCLLEHGARVNAPHGRLRTTPLHLATHSTGASGTKDSRAEQAAIVDLLLQYGGNPQATDANGRPPRLGDRL